MRQRSSCPNRFWLPPFGCVWFTLLLFLEWWGVAGTLGGWCTFPFQLKSRLSHNELENVSVTLISQQVLCQDWDIPVWFGSKGTEQRLSASPYPTRPQTKGTGSHPAAVVASQFGTAVSPLNHKQEGKRPFLLHFGQRQIESSIFRDVDRLTNSNRGSVFIFASAALALLPRGRNYFTSLGDSYVGAPEWSDQLRSKRDKKVTSSARRVNMHVKMKSERVLNSLVDILLLLWACCHS